MPVCFNFVPREIRRAPGTVGLLHTRQANHRRAPDIERGHVDVIEDGVEQGGAAAAAAGAVMEASRCGVSSGSDGRVVSSIGVG